MNIDAMDNLHHTLIFYLGKKRENARKKHNEISKITKFGGDLRFV